MWGFYCKTTQKMLQISQQFLRKAAANLVILGCKIRKKKTNPDGTVKWIRKQIHVNLLQTEAAHTHISMTVNRLMHNHTDTKLLHE